MVIQSPTTILQSPTITIKVQKYKNSRMTLGLLSNYYNSKTLNLSIPRMKNQERTMLINRPGKYLQTSFKDIE